MLHWVIVAVVYVAHIRTPPLHTLRLPPRTRRVSLRALLSSQLLARFLLVGPMVVFVAFTIATLTSSKGRDVCARSTSFRVRFSTARVARAAIKSCSNEFNVTVRVSACWTTSLSNVARLRPDAFSLRLAGTAARSLVRANARSGTSSHACSIVIGKSSCLGHYTVSSMLVEMVLELGALHRCVDRRVATAPVRKRLRSSVWR